MNANSVTAAKDGYFELTKSGASRSPWLKVTVSSAVLAAGTAMLTGGVVPQAQSQLTTPRPSIESAASVQRRSRSGTAIPLPADSIPRVIPAEQSSADGAKQDDLALEGADMVMYSAEEKKLTSAINWSFGGLLALIVLAIAGAPAVVWAPAMFSAVGVLLSCGIQLNKIEHVRSAR